MVIEGFSIADSNWELIRIEEVGNKQVYKVHKVDSVSRGYMTDSLISATAFSSILNKPEEASEMFLVDSELEGESFRVVKCHIRVEGDISLLELELGESIEASMEIFSTSGVLKNVLPFTLTLD